MVLTRTALGDKDRSVRQAAATSLGKIGLQSELEVFHEALNSRDRRIVAIEALGLIKDRRSVEWLFAHLGGSYEKGTDVAIAEALVRLGDPRTIDSFVALLDHHDSGWRKVSAAALDHLGWRPGTRALEARRLVALQRWREASECGPDAAEPLVRCFKEGELCEAAAAALKTVGVGAVEPLIAALHSPHPWERKAAIEVLAEIGDSRAIGPLVEQATMTTQTTGKALAALDQLLTRKASVLDDEALRAVAEMADSTKEAREGMDDGSYYDHSLSSRGVKQLATSELIRRGR